MSLKIYKQIGFALSNAGLLQDVEDDVKKEYPTWSDKKIIDERNKRLKAKTLYSDENKRPKKAKK